MPKVSAEIAETLNGKLEVDFSPQVTLAEFLRCGGAGILAFYTKTGLETPVAEGKPHTKFDGEFSVQELAIFANMTLVHAN